MKLMVFFGLFIGISVVKSDELIEQIKKCKQVKNEIECSMLLGKLQYQKRYRESLEISEILCELPKHECSQSYSNAEELGKEATELVFHKFIKRCEDDAVYCDELSRIYEQRGECQKAIKAAKKYYDKYQTGVYAWFEYKFGDKLNAFGPALKECQDDATRCAFIFRHMPDHPQYTEILNTIEDHCKKNVGKSFGATDCTIVGAYYLKNGNYVKASQILSLDCKENPTACLIIIGSDNMSPSSKSSAFKNFCQSQPRGIDGNMHNLKKTQCSQRKNYSLIPDKIKMYSAKLSKNFQTEQN